MNAEIRKTEPQGYIMRSTRSEFENSMDEKEEIESSNSELNAVAYTGLMFIGIFILLIGSIVYALA